ncbi:DUF362 domain-containing protein [Candidatus Woesearchaeota archaeon]|nr:DUF362 domain-containing protein [Candidatus Woesearchaeota archaeon]
MAKVSIVAAKKDVKQAVKKAVDLIGGFSKFIKKGDTVLLKPNFNSDDPPPASSDPELVCAVVELLRKAGAKEVVIGESSGPFWKPTRKVMQKTGMADAAEKLGAEIKYFDELGYIEKKLPQEAKHLKSILITEELYKYDKLVYVCCLKTHMNARQTLSLKLAMGFPKTSERLKMHAYKLEQKIAELNLLMKPDLIIMDGRKCFVTGGPASGEVKEPGVMLASTDRVAIDIEGIKILQGYDARNMLGMKPEELPMIKRAIELGMGSAGTAVKG